MTEHVVVNGAGIAGCATAYWLRRAGFEVTVVERAPAPRQGGQAVDLRGAGRTVVERMGLLDRVREVTLDQRGIAWVDGSGRRRAEVSAEAFGGRGFVSRDEILRGDLARVLHDAVSAEVEFRFADTVTGLRDTGKGIEVDFEASRSGRYDLVVGADGLHSTVRRLAFGPELAHVRSLGLLTAWFTVPAEVDLAGWFLQHNAPGGRVVSLRPGRSPGEQKAGLSMRTPPSQARTDVTGYRAVLTDAFADVGWEAPRLVRHAQTAGDFFADQVGQVVMPHWSRPRVALVGDAGYCPSLLTGLGTSLALVGAYVLAGELARAGTAASALALSEYERIIRPYVTQALALPPGGVDGYAPRSRARIALGHASMRAATRWPMRPMLDRVFAKADAIDLPDYATAAHQTSAG